MKLMKINYGKLVGLALRIDCDEPYFSDMDSFYSNPMAFSIQIAANILYTAINVEMSKPVHITALQYGSCDSDQAIRIILYTQEGIPVVGFRDAVEKVLDQEDVWVPLPKSLEIVLMHAYHSCLPEGNVAKALKKQIMGDLNDHPYRGVLRSQGDDEENTIYGFYRMDSLGAVFTFPKIDGTVIERKDSKGSGFFLLTSAYMEDFLKPDPDAADAWFEDPDLYEVVVPSVAEVQKAGDASLSKCKE